MWSPNALGGMAEEAPAGLVAPPGAAVVVVAVELVELQAAATRATVHTMPSAADRPFHDAERKAPP